MTFKPSARTVALVLAVQCILGVSLQAQENDVVMPNATLDDVADLEALRHAAPARFTAFSVPRVVARAKSDVYRDVNSITDAFADSDSDSDSDSRSILQRMLELEGIESVQLIDIDRLLFKPQRQAFLFTSNGEMKQLQLPQPKTFLNRPVLAESYEVNEETRESQYWATLGGELPGYVFVISDSGDKLRGYGSTGTDNFFITEDLGRVLLASISGGDIDPTDDMELFKHVSDPFADDQDLDESYDCSLAVEPNVAHDGKYTDIDIVIGFTELAAKQSLEEANAQIRDLITDQVHLSNQSLASAGLNIRLKLATNPALVPNFKEKTYNNIRSMCENMDSLRNGASSLDELLVIREDLKADLAVIVTHHPDAGNCGYAGAIGTKTLFDAVASVNWKCLFSSKYSLAHEIAHLLGANHSVREGDTPAALPPFAKAYVSTDRAARFVTMMGVRRHCPKELQPCARIPMWSSPVQRWYDFSIGSPEHNNACIWHFGGQKLARLSEQFESGQPARIGYLIADCSR